MLRARGLGCRYRRRPEPSLRGIDLDLVAGEVTLLVGGSASGKTTLLRCLDGLIPRSYPGSERTGELRVGGEPTDAWSLARFGRHVGTLLQDPARQIVGLDVFREIAFGPENLGLPAAEVRRRVLALAERLELSGLLERSPEELSGGELQRVALAGVLAMEPGVLLLDEPLAALDGRSARAVAALVRALADEGRAVVVVEHRIEELLDARPDQVVWLEGGAVAWRGTLDAFLERADPAELVLPFDAAVRRWRARDGSAPGPLVARPRGAAGGPESAAPLVELRDVTHRYPSGERALERASLAVRAGETVALLGANGSGKSTLLRHAIGLLRPTAGVVVVAGVDAAGRSVAELARTAALVFQDPAAMLFADTVEEELRFAPHNLGLAPERIRARVDAALAALGLEALRAEPPGALSLGQKKRVCLAALVSQGARLWLLDEPTAGLDPGGVADFLDALRGGLAPAAADGGARAVLLATHDLDLALVHADRIAVLEGGRIVALGTPAQTLGDPELLARAGLVETSLVRANRPRFERGEPPWDARRFAREGAA